MDPLLQALVFLSAAVVFVFLFSKLGLGSVLGYLAAGVTIGPHGLGLVPEVGSVLHVAELGVVLLLFLIGLELQPTRLWELRRSAFGLGGLQVAVTGALLGLAAWLAGLPPAAAVVAGLGLSFSSTALVLQLLGERREVETPHGRAGFGILLFQDLAVIPLLAVVPLLGAGGAVGPGAWRKAALAAVALAAVALAGRWLVRPLLQAVARLRSQELFTATALLVVLGTAAGVAAAGLSMPLGAFLAGVLLSGSEMRHEIEADLEPFKGILLGLFFVAVGMTVDVGLVARRPAAVLGIAGGILVIKAAVVAALARRPLGVEPAASLSILLSQVGEFAFVLFGVAARTGAMDGGAANLLVAAASLTLPATPIVWALHDRFVRPRLRRPDPRPFDVAPEGEPPVIIAGFGRVGQVVGRVLAAKRIPFTALDASAEHIDFIRRFGNKVFYGDASRLDLLRAARADAARVFVLAIDDVEGSIRTAEVVKRHYPHLEIVARARNRQHAYRLLNMGIRRVWRETFASSIELTGDVLRTLGTGAAETRRALARFREHDEALLEASYPFHKDVQKLAEMSLDARKSLQELFERDAADASLAARRREPTVRDAPQ
jgi:glutathione-regulated potassium-efflux system protein KefB